MTDGPDRVGDYQIEAELGAGGMATVYRARHVFLDTVHALKVLAPRFRASPDVRRRFLDEARIQAKYLDHPNIVKVTTIVATTEHAALVMELIDGPSLEAWVGTLKRRPEPITQIMIGVLDGVAHAHHAGIIHRDLKPANVLLSQGAGRMVPKVTDFGIAKVSAEIAGDGKKSTQGDARMGTLHYMSPEQVRRAKDVTARSDIFSLGAMLYELATGVVPFAGDSDYDVMENIVNGRYQPPERTYQDIDPVLAAVIRKALEHDPAHRFASCEEMAAALRGDVGRPAVADGLAAPSVPRPPRPVPIVDGAVAGWQTRPASSTAIVVASIVAAVTLVGWGIARDREDGATGGGAALDGADAAIATMGKIADKLCACKDSKCAEAVMKEMSSMKEPSGKPTKPQMEKAMKIAEKMSDCQKKIIMADMPAMPPPAPPPAP